MSREFAHAVDLLVRQVAHWEQPRWTSAAPGHARRCDVMYRLVQDIADLSADTEGRARRSVPRLDNDMALPDQLRVVAADLIAAAPSTEAFAAATTKVAAVRRAL